MGIKKEIPNKEDIVEYFINQLHTKEECAEYYKVSVSTFSRWLSFYNICKTRQQTQKTIERVNLELYGVPYYKSQESIERAKKTCIKKYGVSNPSQSLQIRRKISQAESRRPTYETLYEYYIIQNHTSEECEKHFSIRRSTLTRWCKYYGIVKSQKLMSEHRKETNLQKYGSVNPLQNIEVLQKSKQTIKNKYNVENITQKDIKHFEEWNSKELFLNYLMRNTSKPTSIQISQYFNVSISATLRHVHLFELEAYVDINPLYSQYENEIIEELYNVGIYNIDRHNREILDGKEIDIYLPDYNFGIEFNGEYYHCDLHEKYQDHNGRSVTHQEKSKLAEKKGVFLFHIFEHEWDERFTSHNKEFKDSKKAILNRLKSLLQQNNIKIDARKCCIKEISLQEKNEFLNLHHIQKTEHHSSIYLGLFFQEELISCMTFGKSKFKKYDWELMRFCSKNNLNVRGGASKLFKYFVNNYMNDNEKIVSYSDFTKSDGKIYKILQFKEISLNDPNYWWVNLSTYDVRSRYKEQAPNEVKRMHDQGYNRICDCGTKTWIYIK